MAETVEWTRLKALHDAAPITGNQKMEAELRLELDGELSAQDLINYWRAGGPPIIEQHIGKCKCIDCQRRLYFGTRVSED